MVIGRIRFLASTIAPKPEEIEYWIDLSEDRYGCVIKCYNGVEWERIDQRTYDEIISFKHKLDELLIEIQECENNLLQHKEDFEEYKNETNSSLNTINEQIEDINASLETLLGESASEFIDKYNEILNFLTGYEDTDTLQSILSDLKNEISQNITEIESNLTSHINNKNNPHNVTKQQVGLSNVTNDAQVKRSEMGTANGIATLNEQGLIPSNQLPSYVDDVIDCYATYSKEEDGTLSNIKLYSDAGHQNAITGESGKIYVDITGSDSAYQFRWTGTQFAVVGAPTVIGEVTGTAFDGARGKSLEDKVNQQQTEIDNKQDQLVSGTNIKTINGNDILGSGNIQIQGSGVGQSGTGEKSEIFNSSSNIANGSYSHAEGNNTIAFGQSSHAEGFGDIASYDINITNIDVSNTTISYTTDNYIVCYTDYILKFSNNSRLYTVISNNTSNKSIKLDTTTGITTGNTTAYVYRHYAKGPGSHVEGYDNITTASYAHAEGYANKITGSTGHVEGSTNTVSGKYAHAEGYKNTAEGEASHVEGTSNSSSGNNSHAEGLATTASGDCAHSEGFRVKARGNYSHAEGTCDTSSGSEFFDTHQLLMFLNENKIKAQNLPDDPIRLNSGSIFQCNGVVYRVINQLEFGVRQSGTELYEWELETSPDLKENIQLSSDYKNPTTVTIEPVIEEGTAKGKASHHQNKNNCAYGDNSYAGGQGCQSNNSQSFTHGLGLIASTDNQAVFGKYNKYVPGDIFEVGIGTGKGEKSRENAFRIDENGNAYFLNSINSAGASLGTTTISSLRVYGSAAIYGSFISGSSTNKITAGYSGTIGYMNNIGGSYSVAFGNTNTVSGDYSGAIGKDCIVKSSSSISMGQRCNSFAPQSISGGYQCIAIGNYAVALGGGAIYPEYDTSNPNSSTLLEDYENYWNNQSDSIHVAFGKGSMVTGKNNLAVGNYCSTHGYGNVAKNDQEFVVGSFNDYSSDTNNLFVVGNGTSHTSRSNAFTVDNSGNSSFSGRINCKGIDAEGACKMGTLTDIHDDDVPWYGIKLQAGEENGGNVWLSGYYGLHLKTGFGQLDFSVNGQMTLNNSFTASGGFYESSDIRLKENVCDITTDKQIDLVQFNWKNTGKKSYGVIAQQIEQNYPELVETNEVTGYKTVKYDSVLILKCAQLENRIKQLEKQLEDLKNE